jgi:UDP-glucose 4-epimerase
MLEGKRPVIYGDGSQTRDFTHVSDVCEALILASQAEGAAGDVFNVCTGESYSITDLVGIINETMGTDLEPEYIENPLKIYVSHTLGDPEKASRVLGFKAKKGLREGVAELVEIQRSR